MCKAGLAERKTFFIVIDGVRRDTALQTTMILSILIEIEEAAYINLYGFSGFIETHHYRLFGVTLFKRSKLHAVKVF